MPNEVDIDYINVVAEAKVKGSKELSKFADSLRKISEAKNLAVRNQSEFDHLLDTASKFKDIKGLGPELNSAASGLKKISEALKSMQGIKGLHDVIPQLRAVASALAPLNNVKLPKVDAFSSGMVDFVKSIREITPEDATKLQTIMPLLERLGGVKGSASLGNALLKLPEALASIDETAIAKLERLAPILERISNAMSSANTQMLSSFKEIAKQIKLVTGGMEKYNTSLKNVSSNTRKAGHGQNFLKNMFVRFKNIAFKKFINTLINNLMTGIREGISNAYQYSLATGNPFANTMDTLASTMLYLRNTIGASLMPVLNALTPSIVRISDAFVDVVNFVNEAIAAFTGATEWTKALKYQIAYADAADNTADALNRTILSIDEINKLNKDNGGASKATEDYSKMFSTQGVSTQMKNLFSGVDLGTSLGKMITKGFENLNSPALKQKIGSMFSKLFENVNSFMTSADFSKLGTAFTNIINTAFDSLKQGGLGKLIGNIINGIVSFISGVNGNTEWGKLGDAIAENIKVALETVKWGELLKTIAISIGESLIAPIETIVGLMKSLIGNLYWELPSGLQNVMPSWVKDIAQNYKPQYISDNEHGGGGHNDGHGGGGGNYAGGTYAAIVDNGSGGTSPLLNKRFNLISQYASGGFPSNGQLFLANEAGPEMVGSFDGRSAVANNTQIVEGIKSGVAEAMSMSGVGGDWTIQIVDKNGNIEAQTVISAVDRKNRRNGKTVMSLGV